MEREKLFARASEAIERKNYDYAIALFYDLVIRDPSDVDMRRALRGAETRRFQESGGTIAKVMAYFKGFHILIQILIGKISRKHEKIMLLCENYFLNDPTNIFVLTCLGSASWECGLLDTAIYTLESAAEVKTDRVSLLRSLGELYTEKGDMKKAQYYYQHVLRVKPEDVDASRAVKDLAALHTMQEGRWEDTTSFRDKIRDVEKVAEMEDEHHILRSDEEFDRAMVRAQEAIEEQPNEPRRYVRLGDIHRDRREYDKAVEAYEKALELDPKDYETKERIGEAKLRKMAWQIDKIKEARDKNPNDASWKEKYKKARTIRRRFAIKEFTKRIEQHPTDMSLRNRLGEWLYEEGKLDEAIGQFQQAARDQRYKEESQHMLGMTFFKQQKYDLAIGQFEQRMEGQKILKPETKETLYWLAIACEKSGNVDKAGEHYLRLYQEDIKFRDVAKKVDELYARKAKQGDSEVQS